MRGIPGSGKSTFAARMFPNATVCSADHYFMNGGVYQFDPAKLSDAHEYCFNKFCDALERGDEQIVIDNTNIKAWEMSRYIRYIEEFGDYKLRILRMVCDWDVAANRCIHNVPAEKIAKMHRALCKSPIKGEVFVVTDIDSFLLVKELF